MLSSGLLIRKFKTAALVARDVCVYRDPRQIAWLRWRLARGDKTLRLDYPLGPDSVVLDIGGFTGDWTIQIARRYACRIYIFEPLPDHVALLNRKLRPFASVKVLDYGLLDRDSELAFQRLGDGSSIFHNGDAQTEMCRVRDVAAVWSELGLGRVDLVKINIEGGEYSLLQRMLDVGLIARCENLQIQFHDFVPNSVALRERLRADLSRTHELTYDYYFVWENWKRRD